MSIQLILRAAVVPLLVVSAFAQQKDTRPTGDLRGHSSSVKTVVFDPTGKLIFSAATNGGIFVWDLATKTKIREIAPAGRSIDGNSSSFSVGDRQVESFALSPDGSLIAEASAEQDQSGVLRLWKSTGEPVRTLASGARGIRCVTFSSDGKSVIASVLAPDKGTALLDFYDVETGKQTREFSNERVSASILAASPDGKWLAAATARKLHIWDLATGKIAHEITSHRKPISGMAFSADSKWLATSAGDDPIRLWHAADGTMIREWQGNQDGCAGLAFSPTGKTLASAGADRTIKLWNPESGKLFERLWGHGGGVLAVAYSSDGSKLASGAADQTVTLWRTREDDFKERKESKAEMEADKNAKKEMEKMKERKRLGLPEKP